MGVTQTLRRAFMRVFSQTPLIPPGVTLGEDVYLGPGVVLDWNQGRHITIEDGATLVSGTRILCHDASSCRRTGLTRVAPVRIRKRAYLGANCIVMPGVTVGEDAIVAAGAVVTHDVAAGAVVAGVPARPIGATADLDARRVQEAQGRTFDDARFNRPRLAPELEQRLREAADEGSYYLR